ncbi:2369_t:CDS:2 [Cetraspora pellucida]|uniref:2369_t:CDS:1 n=1 Tax=Cetraspora pellucida TaxID=1433469 RepID=A0A9N9DT37_9GLOM|nr:2369_t:CDS:2 [Cetraspora pellucida]
MGKPPHYLSEFIIMLEEKANKSNKYCVCKECISGSLYAEAEKNKFANTQELVRRHLKNSEQENSDNNSEASSSKNLSEASSSKNSTASIRKNIFDHYCFWPLNEEQQKHFEQLILKATVSCSWAFSWESIFESILVTSMGRVLVWNAEDISNEHTKWFDVQRRTENMLSNLKKKKIKVNAVVTDCASEYKAASISPKNNKQISLNDNEEELYTSEDDDNINMRQSQINVKQTEIVRCVNDWKVIVEQWVNLAEENDGDYMQYDSFSLNKSEGLTNLYNNDPIFQDDIHPNIHPADNLVAK